ncbi:MAG: tRNA (guanosine(46)-N7)-methyltransferase TrmB [Pirellulales bacterium]
MGRRALPAIDPAIDLSPYLYTFEQLQPWDPDSLFASGQPLEIEVGSGKGLFMQRAALQFPEHNFLGIEIARKYARFSAYRLAQQQLSNAVMVAGDAHRIFRELVPDASLAAIHIYFPDPWWKMRHKKRRVLNEWFAAQIERTLLPGGALHFWTDVQEYYDSGLDILAGATGLRGPLPVAEEPPDTEMDYRTHFERRTRLHGEPVYRSEFRKGT